MPKTRYDYFDISDAVIKAVRTDEGYLKDSPVVARTGILTYRNPDGSIRKELRRPEQVFNTDSLASYLGKPITVDHPKGKVSSKNVSQVKIGTMISQGRQDGKNVRVDTMIHEPDKIGDRRQLSVGYDIELDETPGEFEGERYDAEQTNIMVNHLSVVRSARAGAVARLNMDSDEEPLLMELEEMPKIRLDNNIEYEAPAEVIAEMNKLRTDSATTAKALTDKTAEVSTLQASKDMLQARVDGFPAELKTAEQKAVEIAKAQIAGRSELEAKAKEFKIDCKDKTDKEIKIAVIKTFKKDFDDTGKDDAYIEVAYEFASSQRLDSGMSQQRKTVMGDTVETTEQKKARTDAEDAANPRAAYMRILGKK